MDIGGIMKKYRILENKNCLITGATGGIGRFIALEMAKNKCNLFLTSTNIKKLKKLKDEIGLLYGRNINIYFEHGDLNKIKDVKRIIKMVWGKIKHVNILINCAGTFLVKSLSNTNLNDFEKTFNLNIRAPFILTKEFSKDMKRNGWGRIINIGSSSSYAGSKDTSLYCASKHALLGFSRALHEELNNNNVRIYCLSPAGTKTKIGKLIKNQDFNTFIEPKEIAEYIVFIISFDGKMISNEIRLNRMIVK